jgi:cysteine desulfurase
MTSKSMINVKSCGRRYADNAATTMIAPEVLDAYVKACCSSFGNPSSPHHKSGRSAHDALEWARKVHAKHMGVDSSTIIFTSCGTESNNIAIRGVWTRMRRTTGRSVIITSSIEHSSVRRTAEFIAGQADHIMIPVDEMGYIDEDSFRRILRANSKRIALVSIILAQNEVGTLQKMPKLVRIAREILGPEIPFHTDATQAFGKYIVNPEAMGVDLLTASAHKYHGPMGVGILYAKEGMIDPSVTPMSGGGQERGCRSGTENIPAIVAAAVALERMMGDPNASADRRAKVQAMRDYILNSITKYIPGVKVNGDPKKGLYNILSVSIPGAKGLDIAKFLNERNISIGVGSACNKGKPSEGLLAMGKDPETIRGVIRISLSEFNTPEDCREIAGAVIGYWRALKRSEK